MARASTTSGAPLTRAAASPVRAVVTLYADDRWALSGAALLHALKHSPVLLIPLISAPVVDSVARGNPELGLAGLLLVAVLLMHLPAAFAYVRLISRIVRHRGGIIRSTLLQRLHTLTIPALNRYGFGSLQAKLVRDVEAVEQLVRTFYETGLSAAENLLFILVLVAVKMPWALLLFVSSIPLAVWVARLSHFRTIEANQLFRRRVEAVADGVADMTSLLPLTRAHAQEEVAIARMEPKLGGLVASGRVVDWESGLWGSISWVAFNLLSLVCFLGAAWMASRHLLELSAGEFVMLASYFGLLANAIMGLTSAAPQLTRGLDAVASIREVLDEPAVENYGEKLRLPDVAGAFRFDHVTFRYPGCAIPAVDDFCLSVRCGEKIALVGASGSGKSTLVSLIAGLVEPTAGRIFCDEHDFATVDLRSYRRHVGLVPQDTVLVEGSVRDNVLNGAEGVSDEAVRAALVSANAWEFVRQLPDGMHAIIGQRGSTLSGGQKQRIAIARALVRHPRVLIFDEATSAMDRESEEAFRAALGRDCAGRTTFIVAHRLSTVRCADRIVVLRAGRLVEVGTHDELVARQSEYVALQMTAGSEPASDASAGPWRERWG